MGQRGSFSGAEESSACECGQDEADRQDITRCIGRAESATPRHAPQNRFQLSTTSVACRTTHTLTLTFTLTIQLPFLSASPPYIHTHTRTPRSRPSHIAPRGVWRSAAHFLFSPAAEQSYHSCRKTMAAASLLARTSRSVATRGAWTQLKTQHAATYAIPLLLIHRRHQTLTAMPSQQQNTRALGLGQILCLQMYAQQILLMPLNTALTPFEQPTHPTPSYPCLPSPPR